MSFFFFLHRVTYFSWNVFLLISDEIKTVLAFGLLDVTVHSQLSLDQSINIMNVPAITPEQHRDKNNDDQSRKSPAQQEVEQIASLSVFVIHHQGLPEVNSLRKGNT